MSSFISPSRMTTCAKIAFFDQPGSSRRKKTKASNKKRSASTNNINTIMSSATPKLYKRLHNQPDVPLKTTNPQNRSPRSARSPLGIMLSPCYRSSPTWSVESSSSAASLSRYSSSHRPATITPDRTGTDAAAVLATPMSTTTEETTAATVGSDDGNNVIALLHRHVLDLVPEDPEQADARDEKFQLLQSKLHAIQQGFLAVERERQDLVDKCHRLETEKRRVLRDLQNREQEIATLTKRCTEQAERVKEATLIRQEHRDLNSQVLDLKKELSKSDVHDCHVFRDLKKQLLECQKDRDQLQNQLETIQREYGKVSDSLQGCIQKIAVLNGKQKLWQDSQVMHERATNQQRLQHTVVVQRLQRTLQSREEEIQRLHQVAKSVQAAHEQQVKELEARLVSVESQMKRENQALSSQLTYREESMKRQREEENQSLQNELVERDELIEQMKREQYDVLSQLNHLQQEVKREWEEKNQSLRHELVQRDEIIDRLKGENQALLSAKHEREANIESLRSELNERDDFVATLERDIERNMKELMSAGSTVLQAQEDSAMFQALTADVEALHQEQESLQDQLHERDTAIVELEAQVLRLQLELRLTAESSSSVKDQDLGLAAIEHSTVHYSDQVQLLAMELRDAKLTIQQLQTELDAFQHENRHPAKTPLQLGANDISATPNGGDQPEVQSELFVLESQIVELVNELKQMKIELALRDDEIRELRIVEMGDLEDKLAESYRELAQLSAQLANREAELRETGRGVAVVELERQVSTLKKELDKQAAALRAQERQLKEASADVAIRSQQLAAKQAIEHSLRTELRQLQSVVESIQIGHSQSLENAARMEVELIEGSKREDKLRTRIQSMEGLGTRLDSSQELPGLQVRIKELENEMEHQKMEWSAKEVKYLNELNDERNRREALERHGQEIGYDKSATKAPLGGVKVLREKSNSSRFGFPVSERHMGRKPHRSSASAPAFDSADAMK